MLEGIIPHDKQYFEMLGRVATHDANASTLLLEILRAPLEGASRLQQLDLEVREAGAIVHALQVRVHKVFITPIDRSDLLELGRRLQQIGEDVRAIAQRVAIFHIRERNEAAVELAAALESAARALAEGVGHMPSQQHLHAAVQAIDEIEVRADALYFDAVSNLFAGGRDPVDVLRWKELYTPLEDVVDECNHIAEVLEAIMFKQM